MAVFAAFLPKMTLFLQNTVDFFGKMSYNEM